MEVSVNYARANTDWMANSRFGVSAHWATRSMPERGEPGPFAEAVAAFDVPCFDAQVAETGADYLIFTPNHAQCFFPGPVPAI